MAFLDVEGNGDSAFLFDAATKVSAIRLRLKVRMHEDVNVSPLYSAGSKVCDT